MAKGQASREVWGLEGFFSAFSWRYFLTKKWKRLKRQKYLVITKTFCKFYSTVLAILTETGHHTLTPLYLHWDKAVKVQQHSKKPCVFLNFSLQLRHALFHDFFFLRTLCVEFLYNVQLPSTIIELPYNWSTFLIFQLCSDLCVHEQTNAKIMHAS